jgi:medium-chain acyl-[acyl-carrier-protein] hydrolase
MKQSKWIIRSSEKCANSSSLRLFCFPFAGGGASAYSSWASALSPSIEVCAVQIPGRENRIGEPIFTELPSLVDAIYEELSDWFDVPYAFFGHSMGAKIAFELAYRLVSNRRPEPRCLFFSSSRPPHIEEPQLRHMLSDEQFMAELCNLSDANARIMQSQALLEMFRPILRADFTMDETYRFDADYCFKIPMVVFGGEGDVDIAPSELAAWRDCSSGVFHLQMFSGDHLFIRSCEKEVLGTISAFLNTVTKV